MAVVKPNVNGILLFDKPAGMSSNQALKKVKRLYGMKKKVGHTGNLDPIATGVLPIVFGEATKFSQHLLNSNKRYLVTAKLGEATTTGDIEGEIIEKQDYAHISEQNLSDTCKKFVGKISQTPPMYSALKYKGQPLYKYARKGIEIERKSREIEIFNLILKSFDIPFFDLEVKCSKGTYVRTLVEDIGKILGVGAHVTALRRLEVGPFHSDNIYSLDAIEKMHVAGKDLKTLLLPMTTALKHIQPVRLDSVSSFYVKQGQAVYIPNAPTAGMVRIENQDGNFLGLGEILSDGKVAPKRLVQAEA